MKRAQLKKRDYHKVPLLLLCNAQEQCAPTAWNMTGKHEVNENKHNINKKKAQGLTIKRNFFKSFGMMEGDATT